MTNTPPPLSEKDFINESYKQDPYPFWFWLIVVGAFVAILSGGYSWYEKTIGIEYKDSPFLQVTNREMSVFLWQEPALMRVNASSKATYMPAFQYTEKVSIEAGLAEDYVMAPPNVLFLYHTWNRLVSYEIPLRPINAKEFLEFLSYAEEWQPENWPHAPESYRKIVQNLANEEKIDLAPTLPHIVAIAFQGWKNFFLEGDAINATVPSSKQMKAFLEKYPHYARNYWRNIKGEDYLSSLNTATNLLGKEVPSFLRVAFYNYTQLD